jgi:hypothetical protein
VVDGLIWLLIVVHLSLLIISPWVKHTDYSGSQRKRKGDRDLAVTRMELTGVAALRLSLAWDVPEGEEADARVSCVGRGGGNSWTRRTSGTMIHRRGRR